MKKKFSILIVGTVIVGIVFGLTGMILVSQAAPVEKQQGPNREVPKPIPATNIEVVKKVFAEDMEKGKGKPSSPPKTGGAATGILGDYPATGNKYAVVIGICDYPDGAKNYDICLSDGDSYNMYKALTELYRYDPANIYWFRDMGGTIDMGGDTIVNYGVPNKTNIYNAVMNMKSKAVSINDEVVFFFSGHGASGQITDIGNEPIDEAIVVHDSDGGKFDGNSQLDFIWDEELRILFSDFLTSRIVFVFDSCLAGGMNDVAAEGRVVNMATGETQSAYVWSNGELGEGVFSHYFVNGGMLQGRADKYDHDKDGVQPEGEDVVVEEAFDYAKANIPPYLKVRQKPVISDNFTDDLLL